MIKINQQYLHLFKKFNRCYHYMVNNGVWLSFDGDTLEYIGINMFYFPRNNREINEESDITLNRLIYNDVLEVFD